MINQIRVKVIFLKQIYLFVTVFLNYFQSCHVIKIPPWPYFIQNFIKETKAEKLDPEKLVTIQKSNLLRKLLFYSISTIG